MKQRNREGSITETARGFWLRMYVGDKRKSIGTFATHAEAEAVRVETLRAMAKQHPGALSGTSLRDFGKVFLDEREHDGVRGIRTERSRWKTHVDTAPFADDPIQTITTPTLDAWAKALQKKRTATPRRAPTKISRKTVREVVRLVSMAFDRAMVRGLVHANPAKPIKIRSEVKIAEPWTYLLPAEQTALLTCEAIPEADRLIMAVAIGTGLREGEQFSLRLADVRAEGDHPEIVVRYGSKHKGTKSGKVATIPLFGIALTAMRRWLAMLPDYTRDANGRQRNPDRLVFPGRHGGHRGHGKNLHASRTVTGPDGKRKAVKVDLFREYLTTAGIVADGRHDGRLPRWHDLRHTCASSLVAGWRGPAWALPEVCAYLRHSSITVTQRYAHLGKTALREAAAPMVADLGWLRVGYAPEPAGPRKAHETLVFKGVGRRGLEPRANGLKARPVPEQSRALTPACNQPGTNGAIDLCDAARDVLLAIGRRDPGGRRLAEALALDAVRVDALRPAALAVLGGGDFVDARITELCLAVLDAAMPRTKPRARSA